MTITIGITITITITITISGSITVMTVIIRPARVLVGPSDRSYDIIFGSLNEMLVNINVFMLR